MNTRTENLVSEIRTLPEEEKLKVLDALLADLDRRDSEIDEVWATEARKRWDAYKAGEEIFTLSENQVPHIGSTKDRRSLPLDRGKKRPLTAWSSSTNWIARYDW